MPRTPEGIQRRKARAKELRKLHPEKDRKSNKKWRTANKEKVRVNLKAWRTANQKWLEDYRASHREKMQDYQANYYQDNKEEAKKRAAKQRIAHPERQPAYDKRYRKKHPEKIRAKTARRRASKNGATINDLSAEQWEEIKKIYGNRCVYCWRKMKRLSQDHVIPLSKGGDHTASNIVSACRSCNSKKGKGPPVIPVQPILLLLSSPRVTKKSND